MAPGDGRLVDSVVAVETPTDDEGESSDDDIGVAPPLSHRPEMKFDHGCFARLCSSVPRAADATPFPFPAGLPAQDSQEWRKAEAEPVPRCRRRSQLPDLNRDMQNRPASRRPPEPPRAVRRAASVVEPRPG